MSDALLIEMVLEVRACQTQMSACHIKPYMVNSQSISPLGSVGVAYNQGHIIEKGGL